MSVFIGEVRISTFVTMIAFAAVSVPRRDPTALWAGAAWLTGFESAYQITAFVMGQRPPLTSPLLALPGLIVIPLARRRGAQVSLRLLVPVAVLWVGWIAFGFHANQHGSGDLDPVAEFFNESTKTLWAIAYLLPAIARPAPNHVLRQTGATGR